MMEETRWHDISFGERVYLDCNGKILGEISKSMGSAYIVALANDKVIGRYISFSDAQKAVEKAVKESPDKPG